ALPTRACVSLLSALSLLPSISFSYRARPPRPLPSFPTRRSSDLARIFRVLGGHAHERMADVQPGDPVGAQPGQRDCQVTRQSRRSEEHTSELQSLTNLVCRLLLEKKKTQHIQPCS